MGERINQILDIWFAGTLSARRVLFTHYYSRITIHVLLFTGRYCSRGRQ